MGRHRRRLPRAVLWSTGLLALAPLRAPAQALPEPAEPAAGVLVIEVGSVPAPGVLHLELYDARSQERWGEPLRRERFVVEVGKSAQWRVEGLPQGDYAVRVFLDQNGNGTLDRSRKGIPTEPFGFSNDARRRFGVPRLRVAAFQFHAPEQHVAIQLRGRSSAEVPAAAAPDSAEPEEHD
jgi:uncharacterized protein (DUF2141 family)